MAGGGEFRSVGVDIACHPGVADQIVQQLRDDVAEILEDYTQDEVIDHGVG